MQAVKKRAGKEGWQDLRQKTVQKVDQKLPEKLGESIAEVTARHAQVGKALQAEGIQAIKGGMKPQSFKDARLSLLSGIEIERRALDMDEDYVRNEIYQKFQQFSFIFSMNAEELRRFIKTCLRGAGESTD
ncbi:MAG: hypothetical protein HY376_03415 [Candidatus Blackburnbacteria bacterium]|nr:hypothetical protein [Candidatus Blackburnbacteria bacterium]